MIDSKACIRMKTKKRHKKRFYIVLILSIIFILILITGLIIFPPGRKNIKKYTDENGNEYPNSIAEKRFIDVNGVKMGMIIKGKNIINPVLLFLNGGPGIPDYFLAEKYKTGLEEVFTVCYYDYRGTALSYSSSLSIQTCNTEQFLSDVDKITDYLRSEFNQNKIYLFGHSFGTYIGILTAKAHPEKYQAYLSMSQVVNQAESELLAYKNMKEKYKEIKNEKMVRKLEEYETDIADKKWLDRWFASGIRDKAMHELSGGTMADMKSVITGIFFPSLRCTDYTWTERIKIWQGKAFMLNSDVAVDARNFIAEEAVLSLEIPIYFFAGEKDLTCYYSLQKEYFEKINAPIKKFYTFHNSAHSPLFEEPILAIHYIKNDILK